MVFVGAYHNTSDKIVSVADCANNLVRISCARYSVLTLVDSNRIETGGI
jgi:hypothetical protein